MALQKQVVPLVIDQGLNTKVDIKQEEPGFLRQAQNVVYETIKKLKKRNGYDELDLYDVSGAPILNPLALSKLGSELVLLTDTKLYAYSQSLAKLSERGAVYPVRTRTQVVVKNALDQKQADGIVVENFKIFTWADSEGNVRYSVQDVQDLSYVISNALVAVGERPVLARIQNTVYIIYGDAGDINFKYFSILQPASLSTATTVASDLDLTDGLIDAHSIGTKAVVTYNSTTNIKIFAILGDTTVTSILGITGENATHALDIGGDSIFRIIITWSDGTDVKYSVYPYSLTAAILGPTVVESVADVVTCASVEISSGTYNIYYEVEQASISNNYVKCAQATVAGSVSGISVFKRSVGLASRPIRYNNQTFLALAHESELQSTYFLYDGSGNLVTKWANQLASGVQEYGVLPECTFVSANEIFIPGLFRNRLKGENGTFFSTNGILGARINFAPPTVYSTAELAESLHIASGVLRLYDGSTVTEEGFNVFPEALAATATSTTGGALTNGNRAYVAVYRWTDNTGRDHRSSPTLVPLEVVLSGGTSTQTSTISIPTLRLTAKQNVALELYRTENNGTQFYKVTDDLTPLLNDPSIDTVTFVDGTSDADLISNEALYTTGGVLENIAPGAVHQVCVLNGERIAYLDEEPSRVRYSKIMEEEGPVEYTDAIYRDVDPTAGELTAIRAMQEKLIIFSADGTYYTSGEGPNNLGQQDTFTKPEIVAGDIGCIEPNSLVLTPVGLMFKSRKGIWSFGSQGMQYAGSMVEIYNDQTVTGASIVGKLNQIRFLLSENRALVYNYNLNRWATFENHGGISSVTINDQYFYLREDGALYKENVNSFSDASSPIRFKIETGWLSFGELQGFSRAYYATLLGDFKSNHKIRVRVAYDFVDVWVQEIVIDPLNFIDPATYGEDSPYGSGSPYGGDGNLYQMQVNFKQQKCQAIKLSIEDVQEEVGEGLSLSGITIRAGAKEGTAKVNVGRRFGTS